MIYYVKRMRIKGRPLEQKQLRQAEAVRGDLHVNHESCTLGRSSVVAKLRGAMPMDESVFPELLDATLHSMANSAMVLSGIEVIDGVAYAQSWLCSAAE